MHHDLKGKLFKITYRRCAACFIPFISGSHLMTPKTMAFQTWHRSDSGRYTWTSCSSSLSASAKCPPERGAAGVSKHRRNAVKRAGHTSGPKLQFHISHFTQPKIPISLKNRRGPVPFPENFLATVLGVEVTLTEVAMFHVTGYI